MTKEQSIKRLLYSEFDKSIEGADIYDHLGCKWVIFTNERKWVVEFTKERILWFNYRHFNDIVVLFGMDCYEGSDYIKEWFETRFILIEDIKKIFPNNNTDPKGVIDTIQNGIIEVQSWRQKRTESVKHTIQNGVKDTNFKFELTSKGVNDAIEIGLDISDLKIYLLSGRVQDTIQNGVKQILFAGGDNSYEIEETIQNGVKETVVGEFISNSIVEEAIQNGVKI